MYYNYHYVIDWDKVQTLDDVKLLLKAADISFGPECTALESIIHLVNKEEKKTGGYLSTTAGYLSAAEEPPVESE